MTCLTSGSSPVQQCQIWVPSHEVGLTYNQKVLDHSHNSEALLCPCTLQADHRVGSWCHSGSPYSSSSVPARDQPHECWLIGVALLAEHPGSSCSVTLHLIKTRLFTEPKGHLLLDRWPVSPGSSCPCLPCWHYGCVSPYPRRCWESGLRCPCTASP